MSELELRWLAQQASKHANVVEIGSFLGRSTRALADNSCGRVYAIDTWRDAPPHILVPKRVNQEPDWCWQAFLYNVKDLIPDRLEVRRRKSMDAACELDAEGKQFDLIFIDGAHDYTSVASDILTWKLLLKEGGLLCGHDFNPQEPGLVKAVRELVPSFKVFDTIWYAA